MEYVPDEKVLCFHGPLMYQAKVLMAEDWKGDDNQNGAVGPHFLVHYQGWKKTWDEWVPSSRLMKYTEENAARQKALVDAQKAEAQAAAHAAAAQHDANADRREARKGAASAGRGTKRGRESTDHDESERAPEIKLDLPEALKVQLVDDWENVTRKEQLVPLPRVPNVRTILSEYADDYKRTHKEPKSESRAVLDEVVAGLQLYFDEGLAQNLLYRFERPQYVEMRERYGTPSAKDPASAFAPSTVYGAEHLLRLFGTSTHSPVNLPRIVAQTSMDAESVALLRTHLHALVGFLARERTRLFAPAYETPSTAFQRQGAL